MSRTAKVSAEKSKDRDIWIPCGKCNQETAHKKLAVIKSYDTDAGLQIEAWDYYMTVQCQGCKVVTFCQESLFSENVEFDFNTGEERLVSEYKFFPGRIVGKPEMRDVLLLPHGIYRIYKETHAGLCNKLPILVAIGIRAIVEAVCKEKSAYVGRNMKKSVDKLAAMKLISADGAEILQSLRFMGNKAAHEVKAHTEKELYIAFDVIEHLLKGVYIIPKHASKLPKSGSPS